MIAASPFSCETKRNRRPLNPTAAERPTDAFLAGKIPSLRTRSYPESPRRSSLMKLSSESMAAMLLQDKVVVKEGGVKTRIGLRNPPHLIYKALQDHKQKMTKASLTLINDISSQEKLEHFNKLRQQLQSIEAEIKKLLEEEEEQQQQQQLNRTFQDERPDAPKRRNSIGRSTNIARELEAIQQTIRHEFTPHRKQRRNKQQPRPRFAAPLSIPEEGEEEEHVLWSSCPSLEYEPEPRDLPPKLPTRR